MQGPDVDERDLTFAAALRLRLLAEHLDVDVAKARVLGLLDAATTAAVVRESADRLEAWHRSGRRGARPPGRLRPYRQPRVEGWRHVWAGAMYRLVYDPDGRSWRDRRAGRF